MDTMIMLTGRGPYLGARIDVRPDAAARALTVFRDERRARHEHPAGGWNLALPSGRLLVTAGGDPIEPPAGAVAWPLRRLGGILIGTRARFRVELELTPWSDERSELGIRPVGHWPPRVVPAARYYGPAEDALLLVAGEIAGWARAKTALEVA